MNAAVEVNDIPVAASKIAFDLIENLTRMVTVDRWPMHICLSGHSFRTARVYPIEMESPISKTRGRFATSLTGINEGWSFAS